MGSIDNGPRLAAFQNDVFPTGLDLRRYEALRELGVLKASSSASFEQGMLVAQNSSGELIKADATGVIGIAKWNKVSLGTSVVIDEAVVVEASGVRTLAHPNVSNVIVRTAADMGATITATGDYTLNATNGTLTWDASPTEVSDGDTVYVSYTWSMTEADYRFQGKNFFNSNDDVTLAEGRCTIILPPAVVFTTQYDASRTYAVGDLLYCGGTTSGLEGLFTDDSGEGQVVGTCIQVPTADDPYLGVDFRPERT